MKGGTLEDALQTMCFIIYGYVKKNNTIIPLYSVYIVEYLV